MVSNAVREIIGTNLPDYARFRVRIFTSALSTFSAIVGQSLSPAWGSLDRFSQCYSVFFSTEEISELVFPAAVSQYVP